MLGRKRDAEAFDAEVRRRKRTGELATLDAGRQTLAELAEDWWRLYAAGNLAPATREVYAILWDAYVLPRLGGLRLRELSPEVVQRFRRDLEEAGVGPASARKTMVLLQGVLQRAVEWGRLPQNPARPVRKPPLERERAIRPLPPATVERIRRHLLGRGRVSDATLVSVLAYAGLRPGEAVGLCWRHVQDRTLAVEAAKTRRLRTVPLLAPLAADLAEWRLACRRPPADAPLFPRPVGGPWSKAVWENWRDRVYAPAARAAGVEHPVPYDLRHSFVSLLIHEGLSVLEVARQAGHSPKVCLDTYAHVFDDFDPAQRTPAEAAIRQARDELVPVRYPLRGRGSSA